jgi:hypothetical protein
MSTVAAGAHDAGREGILRDIASKIPVRPSTRRRSCGSLHGRRVRLVPAAVVCVPSSRARVGRIHDQHALLAGIAQAGMVLVSAIRLSNGAGAAPWSASRSRCPPYLPYGYATMMVLLFAGIWTYLPWTKHLVLQRQAPFLNVPFLYIRTLGGLGLLWWLTRRSVRLSLRRDAHLLRDYVGRS